MSRNSTSPFATKSSPPGATGCSQSSSVSRSAFPAPVHRFVRPPAHHLHSHLVSLPVPFGVHRRVRRRGPRSADARERRRLRRERADVSRFSRLSQRIPQDDILQEMSSRLSRTPSFSFDRNEGYHIGNIPPAHACGKPQAADFATESFTFLFLNIQGYVSHEAELDALVEHSGCPTFVGLNETFLPGEGVVKTVTLKGYAKVSRLDRRNLSGWGGILLFVKHGFEDYIVHVGDSSVAERSWHILHTDRGPISISLWYRPPNKGEVDTIRSLSPEITHFAKDVSGHVIVGDLNVHETSWLRFSDGSSPEGRELHGFCRERGLDERVRKPTRGENLLDLVLADLGSLVKARVIPGISDHEAVLFSLDFPLPEVKAQRRQVFQYSRARWDDMCEQLRSVDWSSIIRDDDVDGSAMRFTTCLLDTAREFIPQKWISDHSGSHPWLDDHCRELILQKRLSRGTVDFVARRDACSRGLAVAYEKFVATTRDKMKSMGPSSRGWWKIAKSLMAASGTRDPIPPLRRSDDSWATASVDKAELFSEVFAKKAALDEPEENEFTTISALDSVRMSDGFLPVRMRYSRSVLKSLKENSGTGPDLLAAKILRRCRSVLELPVTLMARAMLSSGKWPQPWRLHWVLPLFKKKSRADASNYRGIHLTPQLSKVLERVIGKTFLPWIYRNNKFGEHQYAYGRGRSHKDALAVNVNSWLLTLEEGDMVALYCSDVFGAFDRVPRERLLAKLSVCGLHPRVVAFLESWLADRVSTVVVSGESLIPRVLAKSVFQGTVLGSPLWNLFYLDAFKAVRTLNFTDVVFADDFNSWKRFSAALALSDMLDECRLCQGSLHAWGRANSVKFDPSKESFHILHRSRSFGDDFLLLGVMFDCELRMHSAISRLAREAGWRLQAILRPRRFFRQFEIMNLYKSLILSFLESGLAAYFHAAPSVLQPIDRIQHRLLRELEMTDFEAFERYKLAPLCTRRDIGMLGLLHRISLGNAPPQLAELFPRAPAPEPRFGPNTRLHRTVQRHDRQFLERPGHTDIFRRSLFGLVCSYNLLPQSVVDISSVSAFQSRLQRAVLKVARDGVDDWSHVLSGSVIRRQVAFQRVFDE